MHLNDKFYGKIKHFTEKIKLKMEKIQSSIHPFMLFLHEMKTLWNFKGMSCNPITLEMMLIYC